MSLKRPRGELEGMGPISEGDINNLSMFIKTKNKDKIKELLLYQVRTEEQAPLRAYIFNLFSVWTTQCIDVPDENSNVIEDFYSIGMNTPEGKINEFIHACKINSLVSEEESELITIERLHYHATRWLRLKSLIVNIDIMNRDMDQEEHFNKWIKQKCIFHQTEKVFGHPILYVSRGYCDTYGTRLSVY